MEGGAYLDLVRTERANPSMVTTITASIATATTAITMIAHCGNGSSPETVPVCV